VDKRSLALVVAAIVLCAGLQAWQAQATSLTGVLNRSATITSSSPVHHAGCLLAGRYCGVGSHWVCGLPPNPERRRCHCVPC
jgi:hypothetical protein